MAKLLFRDDGYLRQCQAVVTAAGPEGIELDRTVFYAESGGQPGDQGQLTLPDGAKLAIVDTKKGTGADSIRHIPAPGQPLPAIGTAVTAEIDWARRYRLMRMHTALHLLSSLVKGDVTGGQVGDGKGRLDFNLPEGAPDKEKLSEGLNRLVNEHHSVEPRWITDEELARQPELVRTMSVKPPSGHGRVRLLEIAGGDLQ
ncbi:MAG TPA: alanyl-tRNA editing protein, partial [Kiloniellales bacterium]|nr:alanyl-tRNA editing protein [Kiloniellales bacterium]